MVALSALKAFAVVRVQTHAIRAGRGAYHNIGVGLRHILVQISTGVRTPPPWPGSIMAALGLGLAGRPLLRALARAALTRGSKSGRLET